MNFFKFLKTKKKSSQLRRTSSKKRSHSNIISTIDSVDDAIDKVKNNTTDIVILNDIDITRIKLKELCKALQINTSVEEINMSGCKIGDYGLRLLGNALAKNTKKKILTLNLADNDITDKGLDLFFKNLLIEIYSPYDIPLSKYFIYLKELNLSNNKSIGDNGVKKIANAINSSFDITALSEGEIKGPLLFLKKLNLSGVNISNNRVGGLIDAINSSNIEELDISNNEIQSSYLNNMNIYLEDNIILKKLNLSHNKFTEKDLDNLNNLIIGPNKIEELNLSYTGITQEMYDKLHPSIKDFIKDKKKIDLSGNGLNLYVIFNNMPKYTESNT